MKISEFYLKNILINKIQNELEEDENSLATSKAIINYIDNHILQTKTNRSIATTNTKQILSNKTLKNFSIHDSSKGNLIEGLNAEFLNGCSKEDLKKSLETISVDIIKLYSKLKEIKKELEEKIELINDEEKYLKLYEKINKIKHDFNNKFVDVSMITDLMKEIDKINNKEDIISVKNNELYFGDVQLTKNGQLNVNSPDYIEPNDDINLPVGTIIEIGGNKAPQNFFKCDGSLKQRKEHSNLYKRIGTYFGFETPNDFKLPDIESKYPGCIVCIKY